MLIYHSPGRSGCLKNTLQCVMERDGDEGGGIKCGMNFTR